MALTTKEIQLRLTELRNLRKLSGAQKVRIGKLEGQVRLLKQENDLLRLANTTLTVSVQTLTVQMEELRTIVFGKKRGAKRNDEDNTLPPVPRTQDSYHRPVPKDTDITQEKHHPIDTCAHCRGAFSERDTRFYFEEDIPLPQQKTVVRHTIERGYCATCRKWSTSTPPPSAPVILGDTVKRYIVYLSVVCRLSYTQIQDVLKQTYDFAVSSGEVAKIMEKEGIKLKPQYERIKASIRGEPSVHLDETSWNLTTTDGYQRYAWTMVGGISADPVFLLGKTRGKGNATDLLGDSKAVVVSDDYGAYRTLEQPHQLCCAHILRKLRDLAESSVLGGATHEQCVKSYQTFSGIYADIEEARKSPQPDAAYDPLLARLSSLAQPQQTDPAKLVRIKKQIANRAPQYLTCLLYPHVVSDNNAAERSLRHLVLKRKVSFGSYSEKTADTLAVLLSVLLSFKRRGTLRGYLLGV